MGAIADFLGRELETVRWRTGTTTPQSVMTRMVDNHLRLVKIEQTEVAVVGGGIMGAMTAAHLAEMGAKVTLYDPHPMGTGPGASVSIRAGALGCITERTCGLDSNGGAKPRALGAMGAENWVGPCCTRRASCCSRSQGDRHACETVGRRMRATRACGPTACRDGMPSLQEWPGMKARERPPWTAWAAYSTPRSSSARTAGVARLKREWTFPTEARRWMWGPQP